MAAEQPPMAAETLAGLLQEFVRLPKRIMRSIKAWVNPLAFVEVDLALPGKAVDAKPEAILRFLCPASTASDPTTLVNRYKEINSEPVRLFAAPAEDRILDKLIWPLRHAKASYMVGNYLAVIALCGMVAEMVALLMWEIAEVSLNGRRMAEADERALLGSTFERLGQERRIQVLSAYGLIDDATKGRFETPKDVRRRYLHLWSQDHDSLPSDAVKAYYAAVSLVVAVIGQDVSDGKIVINQRLVKYLERKGVYAPPNEPAV